MLEIVKARALLDDLVELFGLPQPGWAYGEPTRIPRPALVAQSWGKHDLQAAMLPKVQTKTPEELNEIVAGYIAEYLSPEGAPYQHAFSYVKEEFGLNRSDQTLLFPARRGASLGVCDEDAAYGFGILLWCCHAAGYQLLYGQDWALVLCGPYTFGIDTGRTTCGYEQWCIEVPVQMDWQQFYESTREAGTNEAEELYYLFTRARTPGRDDHAQILQATMVLAWATKNQQGTLASHFYFPGASKPLIPYIMEQVLESPSPVTRLQELLVPRLCSQSKYATITKHLRWGEQLWTEQECRHFVESVLDQLAITTIRKGKTHANSNHREGRRR